MNKSTFVKTGYLWSIIALFATLPMTIKINTYCFIMCCFFWLIGFSVQDKTQKFKLHFHYIFFFIVFFSLNVIGLLWTNNIHTGLKIIEKNVVMFLIPIILLTGSSLSQSEIKKIKYGFIFSCLMVSLIDIIYAIYRYNITYDVHEFFYYQLSQTFDFHPVYLSIYYLFCIILLISFWKDLLRKQRVWAMSATLFLGLNILLLESKMILVISLLLLCCFTFIFLLKKWKYVWISSIVVLLLLSVFGLVLMNFNKRFKEISSFESLSIVSENQMTDFNKINGLTLRLMFWKFSMEEYKPQDMFLGLGTGDVQDFLDKTYEKHNMAISYDGKVLGYYNYDVHNQFIDIFLRFGLVGVVLFIFFIRFVVNKFTSDNMLVPLIFIFIVVITFLTETFLGLNKGIVFFSLFTTLFWMERDGKFYNK